MPSQIFIRREPRQAVRPPEPPRLELGMALVPLAGDDGAGYSGLGSHRPVLQPLVTQEMVTTMLMPDEILVADPRGRLAPAQMVEQKLLALLRTGNPGLYAQAVGSRPDVRRTRGGPESAEARSRDA